MNVETYFSFKNYLIGECWTALHSGAKYYLNNRDNNYTWLNSLDFNFGTFMVKNEYFDQNCIPYCRYIYNQVYPRCFSCQFVPRLNHSWIENDTKNKVKILETFFALQELRGYIYFASENNLENVKALRIEEFLKLYSFCDDNLL